MSCEQFMQWYYENHMIDYSVDEWMASKQANYLLIALVSRLLPGTHIWVEDAWNSAYPFC